MFSARHLMLFLHFTLADLQSADTELLESHSPFGTLANEAMVASVWNEKQRGIYIKNGQIMNYTYTTIILMGALAEEITAE